MWSNIEIRDWNSKLVDKIPLAMIIVKEDFISIRGYSDVQGIATGANHMYAWPKLIHLDFEKIVFEVATARKSRNLKITANF